MLDKIKGTIVAKLIATSAVQALVGGRVFPDESAMKRDDEYPRIVIDGSINEQLRGPSAASVDIDIVCAGSTRSASQGLYDAVKTAVNNERIELLFGTTTVKGSLSLQSGDVTESYDQTLGKWLHVSKWAGKFIEV